MGSAAERRKAAYDIRVQPKKFKIGDWVWLWYPRKYQGRSTKWQRSYVGPYLIVRVIEPVNYVLQRTARSKPIVVHCDKLKPCYGTVPQSWLSVDKNSEVDNVEPVNFESPLEKTTSASTTERDSGSTGDGRSDGDGNGNMPSGARLKAKTKTSSQDSTKLVSKEENLRRSARQRRLPPRFRDA